MANKIENLIKAVDYYTKNSKDSEFNLTKEHVAFDYTSEVQYPMNSEIERTFSLKMNLNVNNLRFAYPVFFKYKKNAEFKIVNNLLPENLFYILKNEHRSLESVDIINDAFDTLYEFISKKNKEIQKEKEIFISKFK